MQFCVWAMTRRWLSVTLTLTSVLNLASCHQLTCLCKGEQTGDSVMQLSCLQDDHRNAICTKDRVGARPASGADEPTSPPSVSKQPASCTRANGTELPRGYRFVRGLGPAKLYRTVVPYKHAEELCDEDGARLAVPRRIPAFEGLAELLSSEPEIRSAYIGINDIEKEGVFHGLDGRPAPYLPWAGRLENMEGLNCVSLNDAGSIAVKNCEERSAFFCERPLRVQVPVSYTWVEGASSFLKLSTESETQSEAQKSCEADGGSLAVPDTRQHAEAILRHTARSPGSFFVGFSDEQHEGQFVTKTGCCMSDLEFRNWQPGEPNNNYDGGPYNFQNGRPENCVILYTDGQYNDVPCDLPHRFLCEIQLQW